MIEGPASLVSEVGWLGIVRRFRSDPDFRASVRRTVLRELADADPLTDYPDPAEDLRYESHAELMDLLRLVGLHGLLAGFLAGNMRAMAGPVEGERGSMLAPASTTRRTGATARAPEQPVAGTPAESARTQSPARAL